MSLSKETTADSPASRNIGPLVEDTTSVRVTYRDTDQMGFVYYANYLVYFEMARTELMRTLGRPYRECEAEGIFLPVVEASCRYFVSARYDDLLEIRTRVSRWTRAVIDFDYEVRRSGETQLLATGVTRHVFTNREGRIVRTGERVFPTRATAQEGSAP
jgi:acyl-CoA thioester hydrolase